MADLLHVSGLTRVFLQGDGRIPVLQDLNLQLRAGQRLTLTGRSGSGKSTLLNLLAGLDTPDAGAIRWYLQDAWQDIAGLTESARTDLRRQHMGFVFQFFNLVPTLTALENVALMAELNGQPDALGRARAQLLRLDLAHRLDAFPETLSGGEQQRVALARALVHRPAVILADEPTGNLDRASGETVFAQLLEAVAEQGTALILVTHDPELVSGSDLHLDLSLQPEPGAASAQRVPAAP